MIKVAVVGIGSIGVHHARIFSELKGVDLSCVVDTDFKKAQKAATQFNCRAYKDYASVLDKVDAVSIAAPTAMHFKIAMECLKNDKDIFIEKPVTSTLKEAETIISEAAKKDLIVQVGHLERFNAGVSLISRIIKNPRFIESSRLSPFPGRSSDVDVTLDLMIHDIDIILTLVKSDISQLRATGAKVLTNNLDIAYAWLEFRNGCIAEVVASRIADKKTRQLKVFQNNAYLTLDYMTQEVTCFRKVNGKVKKEFKKAKESEPLKEQLKSFAACVKNRTQPLVSAVEGKEALQVALKISELINDANKTKIR